MFINRLIYGSASEGVQDESRTMIYSLSQGVDTGHELSRTVEQLTTALTFLLSWGYRSR